MSHDTVVQSVPPVADAYGRGDRRGGRGGRPATKG